MQCKATGKDLIYDCVIRPGDGLVWGQACAEPQTLVEALIAQRAAFSGGSAFLGSSYSGLLRPAHADHLRLSSYCGTGTNRALAEAGVLESSRFLQGYRMIVFGGLVAVLLIYRPRGLLDERLVDAWRRR